MKLTKGNKPEITNISLNIPYSMETTGNYTIININDTNEISKLKKLGYKQ